MMIGLNMQTPFGIQILRLFRRCYPGPWSWDSSWYIYIYRAFILFLTFITYICFHMSRKPITVVKTEILNCTDTLVLGITRNETHTNCTSWITELDGKNKQEADSLLGLLDTSYLMSYAVFMFVSGMVAERVNLRSFLSFGMIASGIFTILFGLGRYWQIHSLAYYIAVQVAAGVVQTTGWPGVVTVVANWFGKGKKGLIFGIWNSHTSIGNIVGGLLAGHFVDTNWGLSFIVPGLIILFFGFVIWMFLPSKPEDVGLELPEAPLDDSFERQAQTPDLDNVSLNQDVILRESLLRGQATSTRSPSHTRTSNNRMLSSYDSDGEMTPLLQSDNSSQASEDYSSIENKTINNNIDSPDIPEPPYSTPRYGTSYTGGISRSRRNTVRSLDSESDCSIIVEEERAISFGGALKIPGVLEFSLCLFFAKLVSYTFLYWLPTFIMDTAHNATSEDAAYFSTLFDIGGIVGGILAGIATDYTGKSASVCALMLIAAIPSLFGYKEFCHSCPLDVDNTGDSCYVGNIILLLMVGLLVNGPYALITTAVSAELGTHPSLRGSGKALATVTSIIDGTGSIGAAVGPFLAGALQGSGSGSTFGEVPGLDKVFYMLMASDVIALILLTRLVIKDIQKYLERRRRRRLHVSLPHEIAA